MDHPFRFLGIMLFCLGIVVGLAFMLGLRMQQNADDRCKTVGMRYHHHAYGGFCVNKNGELFRIPD